MASIIWCARTPIVVVDSPGEAVRKLERAKGRFRFVFFDLADQVAKPEGRQIALALAHVSAVEQSTQFVG